MKELDAFIEQFDPENSSLSISGPHSPLEDEELLQSALGFAKHGRSEPPDDQKLQELVVQPDDEYGEESIRSAISDYYGQAEWNSVTDGTTVPKKYSGTSRTSRTESWGYVQLVAFSFVTASYLLDDYLERNDLQTAYDEAKRRSWLLLLTLALMKYVF